MKKRESSEKSSRNVKGTKYHGYVKRKKRRRRRKRREEKFLKKKEKKAAINIEPLGRLGSRRQL